MDWTNRRTRLRVAVVAIAVLALGVRLVALGARVAHQDEARVAYWAYRYMESGVYWYRPIVHGPFLTIVDSHVFALLGASDFSMRLVVAVVGGLLPLAALLFADRLRDSETVALALVLAANPVLLYYSRFYRNDLLLAGFMLVAFGFLVRAYDRGRPLHLYLGVAFFVLAFTTKENALVYPVIWLGALVLLADRRLLMGTHSPAQPLRNAVGRARTGLRRWWFHVVLAVVEFFTIFVFFYAPRGRAAEPEPTLGATLADPTKLPALVEEAVVGSWHEFVAQWGSGSGDAYLDTAEALWSVLGAGAPVLLGLAVVGFLADRYTGKQPRDVVAFTFFWGAASALGYPIIVDNPFPWEVIHIIVPLAVPAAVGLALIARVGLAHLRSYRTESGQTFDRNVLVGVAAVLVLVLAAGQVGVSAYDTSFENPQSADNELVQYAQSSSEMKPLLGEIRRIVRANDGTDVLYYGDDPDFDGDELHASSPDSHLTPTAGEGWFERLPFAWYLEADGADTNSTVEPAAVRRTVQNGERPPVVIAFGPSDACSEEYDNASDIDRYMDGYERHEVQRFLFDSGCTISSVVVYVDEGYASSSANSSATRAPRPALSPA
ncbi:flippase activity-associated protein Agl23 [Halococcus sediminicola]|uniref:flippase activity-associated protein Agl23 n=1 Tax=Halococcus sediminicola TaxID=1264579 RepID=UPI0006793570|nr:flippase activity-associated protein Agl23 [Halococcus sediminicola]